MAHVIENVNAEVLGLGIGWDWDPNGALRVIGTGLGRDFFQYAVEFGHDLVAGVIAA